MNGKTPMRFVDLSHPFIDRMPTYAGDPTPTLTEIASIEKNGYTNHLTTAGMHVGTHIDAPMHMIPGGKKISDYPVDYFIGHGVFLDARGCERIDETLLNTIQLHPKNILLICTGWSKKFQGPSYFTEYPEMTVACAERIVDAGVKMIGFDTASPDKPPYLVHKIFLSRDILIIENLTHLEQLIGIPIFDIVALPIPYTAGGAPARIIAGIPS